MVLCNSFMLTSLISIFFSKSAVTPKYCLVCVDMFTSKTYTYGMKKKSHLADKLEKNFIRNPSLRKYLRGELRLQTNQELLKMKSKKLPRSAMLFTLIADSMTVVLWEQNKKLEN